MSSYLHFLKTKKYWLAGLTRPHAILRRLETERDIAHLPDELDERWVGHIS